MGDPKTCMVDINNGTLSLECRQGMTLFANLRVHKKYLPTGCGARGACGQCRVRLLDGAANTLTDNEKQRLSEEDLAKGYRLGCQLRVSGDIKIEVPESVLNAREFKTEVTAITPLTYDIRRFSFKLAAGDRAPHKAGQFLNFIAPSFGEVKGQTIRCFSFSTASTVEDKIDIIVRRTPQGTCTKYMFDYLKVGDPITLIGPFGEFYLRDSDAPCVWIAGGSGLSPFMGMLEDLVNKGITNRKVRLFFGAVKPADLYYVNELKEFSEKHQWFRFIPALSGDERCDFCADYGLVTDVVAQHLPNAEGYEAYLCGGPGMIQACIKTLTAKGVKRENIYFDRFG
jgi:Na+-transporting NADH:ubiquinone oxidoreductase, subunit NqrF